MATISRTQTQTWNAEDVLRINNPDKGYWTCVGYAPSKGRRCQKTAAQHNSAAAAVLLRSLDQETHTAQELRDVLHEIAERLLCRSFHQNQADHVATRWYAIIAANRPVHNSNGPTITIVGGAHNRMPTPPAFNHQNRTSNGAQAQNLHSQDDRTTENEPQHQANSHNTETDAESGHDDAEEAQDAREDVRRARAQWMADLETRERSRREAEAERERIRLEVEAHERAEREREAREQAERERIEREAREQAERERLERERAEQERAERERARQETAERERLRRQQERREQAEAARRRREQEARERAQQEQQKWEQSWETYNGDWANMARINTSELDEDVKDSVPWPVKSGKWQDVNPENVNKFIKHAPDGIFDNHLRLRSLLRRQAVRWHEDKIRQFFPRIAGDQETLQLTVVVMQTINAMVASL